MSAPMPTRPSGRVRLAIGVAAASIAAFAGLVATSPPAGAGADAGLEPDLVTLGIDQADLLVERNAGRTLLRFTNEVGNIGLGPLEVFPSSASANCDGDGDAANDRSVTQRLFADSNANGVFDPHADAVAEERGFGCMRYHAAHNHWHVVDFASYELRREDSGDLAGNRRKMGFCIVDSRQAFAPPGAPAKPTYPFGPPSSAGCDESATQGLSVGWADVYVFAVPGQQIDLAGLRRGRYCLVSRVDPANLLVEADEDNNVRRARISLRPRKLLVRRLDGKCRI